MSNPLSASKGGDGVLISSQVAPGDVVHANAEDSGGNDSLSTLVVVNPNPNTITLYLGVSGPDITQVRWERHDIPSTDEGQEPTPIYVPMILAPGYTLSAYAELSPGYQSCIIYGAVDKELSTVSGALPGMTLGGTATSFTLNTTESKIMGYSLAGQWNWADQEDVDPVSGEITIPRTGIYTLNFAIIGQQGNSTKEEWIEARLRIDTAPSILIDTLSVDTDKTSGRALGKAFTRILNEGQKLSLWMWASAGLGTFTIEVCTFEAHARAGEEGIAP